MPLVSAVKVRLSAAESGLALFALAAAPAAPAKAAAAPAGVASCERLVAAHAIVKAMTMFESQLESQLEQVKKMLEEDNMQHVHLLVFALECILRETSQSIEEKKQRLLSMLQSSDDSNENGGEWL
jgi:hypothetical protein